MLGSKSIICQNRISNDIWYGLKRYNALTAISRTDTKRLGKVHLNNMR